MKEIQILNNGDSLYDIRRKINENFELTQTEIEEGNTDPLSSFGANEGNVTDGVADLIDVTDGTLNFKVGGDYPNLVITSGNGTTQEIESVKPLYLQNLADGEYKVVVDGSNSNITDAEFYSQLLEPENPNNGDVWFNGENSKQFQTDALTAEKTKTNSTANFQWVAQVGDSYVASSGPRSFLVSTDGGANWTSVSNSNLSGTFSHIGAVTYDGDLYTLGNDKNLYKNPHTTDYTVTPITLTSNPTNFKFLGGKFVATCQSGYVWYSDDLINWHETEKIFDNLIKDITFGNDTYYIIGQGGEFAYSSDFTAWTQVTDTSFGSVATSVKYYDNKVLIGKNNGYITIFDIETQEKTELKVNPNESVNDITILANNCILAISNYGTCYISYDHVTFTRLIDVGDIYLRRISLDKFVVGDSGIIIGLNQNVSWIPYPYIPIGEVAISGGEVTYFTTYPYNSNGLHEASSSTFGLMRTAAPTDEVDCSCTDAVITPANLYKLADFRLANTEYQVGDTVACPYHNDIQLKCVVAGTTSREALDTRGKLVTGDLVNDGSVLWVAIGINGLGDKITNCITQIPQRIKADVVDGTLTVYAGTVAIVPYGTADRTSEFPIGSTFIHENFKVVDTQFADDKFFVWVEVQNNIIQTTSHTVSENRFAFINLVTNIVDTIVNSESGTSSSATNKYTVYYNTNTNMVGRAGSSTELEFGVKSLPIFIHTSDGTNMFASIKQTFNGIGYIGSGAWSDKGIKYLASNGINADGTYKNIERTTDKFVFTTGFGANSVNKKFYLYPEGGMTRAYEYYNSPTPPDVNSVGTPIAIWEDTQNNLFYRLWKKQGQNEWTRYQIVEVGTLTTDADDKITEFNIKQPFRAADYNDIDGVWVEKYAQITNVTAVGTYEYELPLPNDNSNYEVLMHCTATRNTNTAVSTVVYMSSIIKEMGATVRFNDKNTSDTGWMLLPVGGDHKIKVQITGVNLTTNKSYIFGYRKTR